jgi:four helix bundle protein
VEEIPDDLAAGKRMGSALIPKSEGRGAKSAMRVRDFRELNVYRIGFESAMEIFEQTKSFPSDERFSLTDQIRRSSRSVCANIAEAWRKRRYPASFISKLSDADAEAAETQVWLDTALRCGYISVEFYKTMIDRYDHIGAQLVRMMSAPEQWCTSPRYNDRE